MSDSLFNRAEVNHLNAEVFEKKLIETEDAVLIDVRTKEENLETRIPNSILLNMYEPGFINHLNKLEKNKSYFVYCHSGGRSSVFCEQMIKMGFEKVFNLEYGIISWHGKLEQG
jgi:phage shock protein E